MKLLARIPPGTLLVDQQIQNSRFGTAQQQPGDELLHRHKFTLYEPRGPVLSAMVALHGGGGNQFQYAGSLAVLTGFPVTVEAVRWPVLEVARCALIVPQALPPVGLEPLWGAGANPWNEPDVDTRSAQYPDGVPLWPNRAFWGTVDTPQFLRDLAVWINARYGSGVLRILAGHSAGGIMVNRMWQEHVPSAGYTNYCVTSASASVFYAGALPTVKRPYHATFGALDTNLGISGGNFPNATYTIQGNPTIAWTSWPAAPQLVGGLQLLQARVDAYNAQESLPAETIAEGDGVTAPVATGLLKTWAGSGGANVVRLASAADHSNQVLQRCVGKLQLVEWCTWAYAYH